MFACVEENGGRPAEVGRCGSRHSRRRSVEPPVVARWWLSEQTKATINKEGKRKRRRTKERREKELPTARMVERRWRSAGGMAAAWTAAGTT